MSITFHSDGSIVHLTNGTISYVIELLDHTYLLHRYFGQAIRAGTVPGSPFPASAAIPPSMPTARKTCTSTPCPLNIPRPASAHRKHRQNHNPAA